MAQTFGSERVPKNSPWFEKIDVADFIQYGTTLDAALQIELLRRLNVAPNPQAKAILEIFNAQTEAIASLYLGFFQNLLTCFMLSLRAEKLRVSEQAAVLEIGRDKLGITQTDILTESDDKAISDAVEVELAALFMLSHPKAEKVPLSKQSYSDIPESEMTYFDGHVDTLTEKWQQFQFLQLTWRFLHNKIRISYSSLQPGKSLTVVHPNLNNAVSVWNSNQTPEDIYTLITKQFARLEDFIVPHAANRQRYEINEMLKAGHFLAALIRVFKQVEHIQSSKLMKKTH